MTRQLRAALVLALAALAPMNIHAHEGHAHKVMGTVTSISGTDVMVKTTDGKTVMVMLNAKTKITRGKEKLTAAALKVGDRVVAEGSESKGMVTAETLQLGTAAAEQPADKPAANTTGGHGH